MTTRESPAEVTTRSSRRLPVAALGLGLVLALGAVVRIVALVGYHPSTLQWVDGVRYARIDPQGLFSEYWWPAGYSAFLIAARSVWDQLTFTIALQHVLGLVAAALLYASARRLGAPRGVALVPAALAALVGDFVYLEHIVMADGFFGIVAVAGLYLAVRSMATDLTARARTGWLIAAAAALTAAGLVRTTGLVLPIVFAAVLLLSSWAPLRRRAAAAGMVVAVTVVIVGAYMGLATVGQYNGLFTMGGWHTYARIAPTADCRTFTPPAGTRFLCEDTPVAARNGSFWYEWDAASPARRRFTFPEGNETLGKFGRAAIAAHPLGYLKIVAKDSLRSIEPTLGRDRPGSGITGDMMVFGYRDTGIEQAVGRQLDRRYDGVLPVSASAQSLLDSYQRATRVGSLDKLVLIILALAGAWAATGLLRRGIALYGLSALALAVAPAATLSYDIRYMLPAQLLLGMAGALGGWALWLRFGARAVPEWGARASAQAHQPDS